MVYVKIRDLIIGEGYPIQLMAIINVSPESFYRNSVKTSIDEVIEYISNALKLNVKIFDIGGMSTAPYRKTWIPIEKEVERILPIVKELRKTFGDKIIISIDTFRSKVAEECLKVGVDIVNDVTGLKFDKKMINIIKKYNVHVIIVAREIEPVKSIVNPVEIVIQDLKESIDIVLKNNYDLNKVIVDPGIGFPPLSLDPNLEPNKEPLKTEFRYGVEIPWYIRDLYVTMHICRIFHAVKRPICIGISRKSFIGKLLDNKSPEERLFGTLILNTYLALQGCVHILRVHDIEPHVQLLKIVNSINVCREDFNTCIKKLAMHSNVR